MTEPLVRAAQSLMDATPQGQGCGPTVERRYAKLKERKVAGGRFARRADPLLFWRLPMPVDEAAPIRPEIVNTSRHDDGSGD